MVSSYRFITANLTRRWMRTLVTASGVAVATAAVFSLLSFQRNYQAGLSKDLDRLGASILVVPKGCPYDAASLALRGASWPCYLKQSYVDGVARTPHVLVAAPVLMSAMFLPTTGAQVVYCGVLPNIVPLKRLWRIQGQMLQSPGDILVGSDIAKSNGWQVGQRVALPGLPNAWGHVAGILKPTQSNDDLFIYMPLADAQRIFQRPGQITHILVRLDRPDSMDEVVANLRGCDAGMDMNVVPLAHLFVSIRSLIAGTHLLLCCVALVAVLAAGAGLSNTVLMAVTERTREIGVLRALGGSQGQVFRLICGETVAICVSGGIMGIVVAILSATSLDAWLRQSLPLAPHDILIRPDAGLMLASLTGALIVGGLASLLPAARAAGMSPALAIRAVGGDV
jgi:putative ABC transport system permease protein